MDQPYLWTYYPYIKYVSFSVANIFEFSLVEIGSVLV